MKKLICLIVVICSIGHWGVAQAAIACEKQMPRCTPTAAGCTGSQIGTEFTAYFRGGSHKSPAYSLCPVTSGNPTCTNDRFRSPASWDYDAYTADYEYLWYPTFGFVAAGTAYVQVYDQALSTQMTPAQWSNVVSISYIDVDVAWSTSGVNSINLEMPNGTLAASWVGNYPNGTLVYVRLTYNPGTGIAWTKAQLTHTRDYSLENAYDITANTPGLFIHSITETAGFQYNGTACP